MSVTDRNPSDNLRLRGDIVQGLQQDLIHGGHSLKSIPETISLVIEQDLWRERVEPQTVRIVAFDSFEEFVAAPPLEGLGSDIRQLKHICRDDADAVTAIDKAVQRPVGRPKNVDNIHNSDRVVRPSGTSQQRALRRLREQRPDLHQQVLDGKKSPHAAMVEAGFRKKTVSVNVDDAQSAARTLKEAGSPEYVQALAQELVSND